MPLTIRDLTIRARDFGPGERIPDRFTAYHDNAVPELEISGVPEGTVELAVAMYDPDAPLPRGFVHWTVYGIDPAARTVGGPGGEAAYRTGPNSAGERAYTGPRPPRATASTTTTSGCTRSTPRSTVSPRARSSSTGTATTSSSRTGWWEPTPPDRRPPGLPARGSSRIPVRPAAAVPAPRAARPVPERGLREEVLPSGPPAVGGRPGRRLPTGPGGAVPTGGGRVGAGAAGPRPHLRGEVRRGGRGHR